MLGVEYALTVGDAKYTHRSFVPIEVKTLEDSATEASSVTAPPSVVPADSASAGAAASATPTATKPPAKGGGSRALTATLLSISVVAIVALVVFLLYYYNNRGSRRRTRRTSTRLMPTRTSASRSPTEADMSAGRLASRGAISPTRSSIRAASSSP